MWDSEAEEYVAEEDLDDSDIASLEELLLLMDSYDQSYKSVENVTSEQVDSLKPYLTDRLYEMRSDQREWSTGRETSWFKSAK